jgi:hypothetical protein
MEGAVGDTEQLTVRIHGITPLSNGDSFNFKPQLTSEPTAPGAFGLDDLWTERREIDPTDPNASVPGHTPEWSNLRSSSDPVETPGPDDNVAGLPAVQKDDGDSAPSSGAPFIGEMVVTKSSDVVASGPGDDTMTVVENAALKVYDWPGEYAQRFDGIDKGGGDTFDFQPQFTTEPTTAADFDNNGDVDGRDFLAWQRGNATPANGPAGEDDDDPTDWGAILILPAVQTPDDGLLLPY